MNEFCTFYLDVLFYEFLFPRFRGANDDPLVPLPRPRPRDEEALPL